MMWPWFDLAVLILAFNYLSISLPTLKDPFMKVAALYNKIVTCKPRHLNSCSERSFQVFLFVHKTGTLSFKLEPKVQYDYIKSHRFPTGWFHIPNL